MPRIPDAEIDRIKRETDLVTLARSRGIELKKHGSRDFIGKCPFHDDSGTPNFIISPGKGLYHCMACGAAGNAIQFVEKFDGVSFRHAFELLANGSALEDPPDRVLKAGTVRKLECPLDPDASDAELTSQVIGYYHERLFAPENAKAREMLEARGLWHEEAVKRFCIGFADRTLGLRLPPKNRRDGALLRERLIKLGLYRESGHEHFNGSIILPIHDQAGNVVEIYGRKITQGLRPGTPNHLYLPGPHAGIWNAAALDEKEVILCEAPLDALTFYVHGIENVTFIFGTQGFTGELLDALVNRKTQSVKLAYDADEAGNRAAERDTEKLMAKGIEVFRVRFPAGMDVNEYASKVTPAAKSLRHAVDTAIWLGKGTQKPEVSPALSVISSSLVAKLAAEEAPPVVAKKESGLPVAVREGDHWGVAIGDRRYRVSGLEKNAGFESLKITLRLWWGDLFHLDSLDLCADTQRRKFIERAASETKLETELIKRDLGKLLLVLEGLQEERLRGESEATGTLVELTPEERREAEELLGSPDLIERIGRDFETCGMVGEGNNRLVGYLACTSRLLRRPLAVIIQSTSAAGKSTLMEAILALFPEEERIKYSAMTGQSLYYLGESNLKHKILAIVEEEGAERASYALKLLQSEGELTIASTGKNPKTGQMETQSYHVEGPVMIFLTTTAIDIDEELQNRCLTLTVDESTEQTKRIHEVQRAARTLAGIERSEAKDDVLRAHRNAQRLLESLPIYNPFVEQLTFTSERTRTRRDHEKYLTLIDVVTLLHQKQRERVTLPSGRHALAATLEDIKTANRLAPEVLGRSLDELPPQTRKLWNVIKSIAKEADADWKRFTFTRKTLREKVGWSVTQVRVHLERLHELEYIIPRGGRNGIRFEYGVLVDPDNADGLAHIGLIDPEKLQNASAASHIRPAPDGKKGKLTAPDKIPKSGSSPDMAELSAQPDGLTGTHIRDTQKPAIVS
jgi:DNA primase